MNAYEYMDIYESVFTLSTNKVELLMAEFLQARGYRIKRVPGYYVAAIPQDGAVPICLVAHYDIIHKSPPKEVYADPRKGVLWASTGLGADDRAGITAVLELITRGHRPYILLTDLEESGGLGAQAAVKDLILPGDIKYLLEIDRRNGNEAVFYDNNNRNFIAYITEFGWKESNGIWSDISILCPDWGIAGVNVSCGYYNPHMNNEYMYVPEWIAAVARVENMLLNPPIHRFDYVETIKVTRNYIYSPGIGSASGKRATTPFSTPWKDEYLEYRDLLGEESYFDLEDDLYSEFNPVITTEELLLELEYQGLISTEQLDDTQLISWVLHQSREIELVGYEAMVEVIANKIRKGEHLSKLKGGLS